MGNCQCGYLIPSKSPQIFFFQKSFFRLVYKSYTCRLISYSTIRHSQSIHVLHGRRSREIQVTAYRRLGASQKDFLRSREEEEGVKEINAQFRRVNFALQIAVLLTNCQLTWALPWIQMFCVHLIRMGRQHLHVFNLIPKTQESPTSSLGGSSHIIIIWKWEATEMYVCTCKYTIAYTGIG